MQIPLVLWRKMIAEADKIGQPIAKILSAMLQDKYGVKDADMPKPKRVGRKPKKI